MDNASNSPAPASASATAYDPNRSYDVQLSRQVEWPAGSGFFFYPRDHQEMSGAVCQEIAHAIAHADPL